MPVPLLELKSISKSWPGVRALDSVDFSLESGEVHALIGENGAGKSTMIKILTGAIRADSGEIVLDGRSYQGFTIKQAQELGIGAIYQELNLIPNLSIAENVFFGREFAKQGLVDFRRLNTEAGLIIKRMGFDLDPRMTVGRLGTAWQQIVEIAIAISKNTRILIMDEPTAPLSTEEVSKLFQLIRRLKADGVSIIYISHRLEELYEICDRVTVLRDGARIDGFPIREAGKERLISLMVGRPLLNQYPPKLPVPSDSPPVLEVEGLQGGKFRNVSMVLRRGEILGLAGLVGAGRTELVRAIFGADAKTAGVVRKNGRKIEIGSPLDAIRNGIVLLPEERKSQGLFLNLSLSDNMVFPNLAKYGRLAILNAKLIKKDVLGMIASLRIKTSSDRNRVLFLSGGNQQKVIIARWMLMDADVIIFDEPTRGIDVGAKFEIYMLMNKLKSEGRSLIVISSDMQELIGVSDRVYVMCNGRMKGELVGEAIGQERILRLAADFSDGEDVQESVGRPDTEAGR
jgi:ribose transport system ATP-binding protein